MARGPFGLRVRLTSAVALLGEGAESMASTLKSNVPDLVENPESVPEGSRVRPGGIDPESTDHEYGPTPPVAEKVEV
jgi:hypothetical protein